MPETMTPTPTPELPKHDEWLEQADEMGNFKTVQAPPESKVPESFEAASGLDKAELPKLADVDAPAPEFQPGEVIGNPAPKPEAEAPVFNPGEVVGDATPDERAEAKKVREFQEYGKMVDADKAEQAAKPKGLLGRLFSRK